MPSLPAMLLCTENPVTCSFLNRPGVFPALQGIPLDTHNLPMEPPPPYPLYQQSQQTMQQQLSQCHPSSMVVGQQRQQQGSQQQPVSPVQNIPLDFNSSTVSSSSLLPNIWFNSPLNVQSYCVRFLKAEQHGRVLQ